MDFKIGDFAVHKNVVRRIKKLDTVLGIATCDNDYVCLIHELKHIFEPPFSTDDYGIYMFDADENICLDYYSDKTSYDGDILKQLCSLLNGESDIFEYKIEEDVKNATDCFIALENGDIITVRGWGYLTGVKHLSNKDASIVQNSFLDWIVNKIKEAQNELTDEKDKS